LLKKRGGENDREPTLNGGGSFKATDAAKKRRYWVPRGKTGPAIEKTGFSTLSLKGLRQGRMR